MHFEVSAVIMSSLCRHPFLYTSRKLRFFVILQEQHVVDFDKLGEHVQVFADCEAGFCCMGGSNGRAVNDVS